MKFLYIQHKNQTKTILLDDEDFEKVSQYRWCVSNKGNKMYAMRATRKNGKYKAIYMHRFILSPKDTEEVDHINHNTLDNRRSNLRITSHYENMLNLPPQKSKSSPYKGVKWVDKVGKFVSYFKEEYIGSFESEIDAALAYNATAYSHSHLAYINKIPGISPKMLTKPPKSLKNAKKLNRYRGVRRRSFNCFEAYITYEKKRYVIGYESTELAAVKLYNDECDRLNLPKRKNPLSR